MILIYSSLFIPPIVKRRLLLATTDDSHHFDGFVVALDRSVRYLAILLPLGVEKADVKRKC